MRSRCPYCDGILGIHCFNVEDCGAVTRSMQSFGEQSIERIQELETLLNDVLDSDMAQREEDEGNVSELLNRIRESLGLTQIDAVLPPPITTPQEAAGKREE